jgi:hypothetical protein
LHLREIGAATSEEHCKKAKIPLQQIEHPMVGINPARLPVPSRCPWTNRLFNLPSPGSCVVLLADPSPGDMCCGCSCCPSQASVHYVAHELLQQCNTMMESQSFGARTRNFCRTACTMTINPPLVPGIRRRLEVVRRHSLLGPTLMPSECAHA